MNTEKHYSSGGEPHYKRVKRLGLSWCRANITKYAERTKGAPIDDLLKVADYAIMELEDAAICTAEQFKKAMGIRNRMMALLDHWEPKQRDKSNLDVKENSLPARYVQDKLDDGSDPVARGYVNQGDPYESTPYLGKTELPSAKAYKDGPVSESASGRILR